MVRGEDGCVVEGFIDKRGEYVVEPQYTTLDDYSEGLAHAYLESDDVEPLWSGFLDREGKRVLPVPFTTASGFRGGGCAPCCWKTRKSRTSTGPGRL